MSERARGRFLSLIWVNLRRHRIRALIGAAGIAFGAAAMLTILAVVTGAIGMFERILDTDTDLLVFERGASDLFFSSVTAAQVAAVRATPGVAGAYPLLFAIAAAEDHPVITCFGVEPGDPRLNRAKWQAGGPADFGVRPGEVFLGSRAAEFLGVGQGGKVDLGSAVLVVGGIFTTENGFEDGGVFLPLREAQALFHRADASSVVAVKLADPGAETTVRRLIEASQPKLKALANQEFSKSYSSFKILNFTAWAVGVCAFVLGGLGVANTMLLSVFGRIREIAVLRVCGFSPAQVAGLILGEALVVAATGLVAGFALGFAVLAVLERVPQFHGYVQASLDPRVAAGIVVTALITATAGAIYPARFAARIQAAEALRYE